MKYGIQMYSLRDITSDNLDGALKAVADMATRWWNSRASSAIPPRT